MSSTLPSRAQSRSAAQPRARALSNLLFVVAALVFAMVVVGGTGSIVGSILGAAILVGIPELETFLPLPIGAGAFLQQVLYAMLVLLFLVLRPQGILGRRAAVMRAPLAEEETAAPAAEASVSPTAMRRGA